MILYVLAIEELILRIKNNTKINGYKLNILQEIEIKISAYADDIVGYVLDETSIKEFFLEFDKWGEISGAKINKDKTKILKIGCDQEKNVMKVLGVIFDKYGVSGKNLENILTKIQTSINIWNKVKINILERIVICKTFLLSKVYFFANFVRFESKIIEQINTALFKFIYNNNIELVNRGTLILPYERGGLSLFNLESRLKTIILQQFIYITKKYNSPFYALSVYWMKFDMRELKIRNFNITPAGNERERPVIYNFMTECVREFKNIDKNFIINSKQYTSKRTYELFSKKYEKTPTWESLEINLDYLKTYKKIHHKKLNSELRSFNYRIINNSLTLYIKYPLKKKNPCLFCNRKIETRDHLFLQCTITKNFFDNIKSMFSFLIPDRNRRQVYYCENIDGEDLLIMSCYKLALWKTRSLIEKNNTKDSKKQFLSIFTNMKKKYYF